MPKDKQTKVQQKIYSAAKGLKQKLGISEKSENKDNVNNDENNESNTKSTNTPIMENKSNKRKGAKKATAKKPPANKSGKKKKESIEILDSPEKSEENLHNLHIDDTSEGENSWDNDSKTEEDDANTVKSDETSNVSRKDQDKIILPKITRYQMMILLDKENNEAPIEETKEEEKTLAIESEMY